jgi:hypothetical protein
VFCESIEELVDFFRSDGFYRAIREHGLKKLKKIAIALLSSLLKAGL